MRSKQKPSVIINEPHNRSHSNGKPLNQYVQHRRALIECGEHTEHVPIYRWMQMHCNRMPTIIQFIFVKYENKHVRHAYAFKQMNLLPK